MRPDSSYDRLALADELLNSVIEQLRSDSGSHLPCSTTLRQVTEKLHQARIGFSDADKSGFGELIQSIRSRAARVGELLDSAASFYDGSTRKSSTALEYYTPEGLIVDRSTCITR